MLAFSAGEAESGDPVALLPDLSVERPKEIYLRKRAKATRLRISHTVANRGNGPLELYADGAEDPACDRDGLPSGRRVWQRIYNDGPNPGSTGHFNRQHDTDSAPVEAGCMRFHPQHDHWHFDDFAHYSLISEKTGKEVGLGRKVSFCVIDSERIATAAQLPGTQFAPFYYPGPGKNGDGYGECTAESTDGLSIGWADTYGAALPGQAINITGRRSGYYCLWVSADPSDRIAEIDETNNELVARIRIRLAKNKVVRKAGACKVPLPKP